MILMVFIWSIKERCGRKTACSFLNFYSIWSIILFRITLMKILLLLKILTTFVSWFANKQTWRIKYDLVIESTKVGLKINIEKTKELRINSNSRTNVSVGSKNIEMTALRILVVTLKMMDETLTHGIKTRSPQKLKLKSSMPAFRKFD